ncbi:MAG: hypothetical protein P8Y97_23155, partial [Candidatus Lokiarchaeota archaeon]
WAFIIAPFVFDLFMPTIAQQYSEIFRPVVALLIESFMMGLFLMLLMYPLNNVYRESEINFKESLLASPVRERDIFFGEYLGKLPIYSFAILILAPVIVGMINPLINLTLIQYIVIYACTFGVVSFANLIGSILASWLENKISKSEKFRDLGKVLIWILTIILVIIMYAVIFFLNQLLSAPELKNWVMFYPSFWFSNIILYMIDPTLLSTYILNVWLSLILAIFVPLTVLSLSYRHVNAFYSLEGISTENISKVKHENLIFIFISKLVGFKWGGLIVVQLKRFFRKKANIARIIYTVGLVGFMGWFSSSMTDDFEGILLSSTILIALGGAVASVMLSQLIFVNSKEVIWVYKRSPRGIKGLIYSYLISMLIISAFISLFITVLRAIFVNYNLLWSLIFYFLFLINMEICMVQGVGLQCINPAFGEKDANMKSNSMIAMLIQQPSIMAPIFLLIIIRPDSLFSMIIIMLAPLLIYNLTVAITSLSIGIKKLKCLE